MTYPQTLMKPFFHVESEYDTYRVKLSSDSSIQQLNHYFWVQNSIELIELYVEHVSGRIR